MPNTLAEIAAQFTKKEKQIVEDDVRGTTPSNELPEDSFDLERRRARKIMKAQHGPYLRFDAYYPLEDVIDLYLEIWNESSESSDEGIVETVKV